MLGTSIDDARSAGIAKALAQNGRDGAAVGLGCDDIGIAATKAGDPAETTKFLGCVAYFPEKYPGLRRCRSGSTSSRASRCPMRSTSSTSSSTRLTIALASIPERPADRLARCPVPLLELTGVSKTFGPVVALDRVDLTIGAAEAVGLIGDNGAGKSTLVKILSGRLPADRPGRSASTARRSHSAARSMPAPRASR